MLSETTEFEIIGEARSVEEIGSLLTSTPLDVIVLDDSLWDSDALLEEARSHHCSLVLLSEESAHMSQLAISGLRGWAALDKSAESEELAGAVIAASANLVILSPFHAVVLKELSSVENVPARSDEAQNSGLTAREMEVLQLVARGLPNKNIANLLHISLSTAKFHVASILSKLNVSSRTEAVTQGAKRGLVTL